MGLWSPRPIHGHGCKWFARINKDIFQWLFMLILPFLKRNLDLEGVEIHLCSYVKSNLRVRNETSLTGCNISVLS